MKKSSWSQKMSEVYSYKSASAEGNDSTIKQAKLNSFHRVRLSQVFLKVTCERELRALNMSKKTKQVKVMVVSRGVITLSCNWKHKDKLVIICWTVRKSADCKHGRFGPTRFSPAHSGSVLWGSVCSPLSRRRTVSRRRWWAQTPELWWADCEWWCCLWRYEEASWWHHCPQAPPPNWQHNNTLLIHNNNNNNTLLLHNDSLPVYLWAGGPSMMMLIHRICMAFSGLGKFISVAREMSVRAAMLLWAGVTTLLIPCPTKRKLLEGNERVWLTCSAGSGQSS